MSWVDDIQKAAGAAVSIGRRMARAGLAQASDFAERVEAEARIRDFDNRINKAAEAAKRAGNDGTHTLVPGKDGQPAREPKAIHFNPFDVVSAMGYRERPTSLTFSAMEMIGRGVPVIADVVGTRVKQVQMFCDLPEDRYAPGFRVRRRDFRERSQTKADEREARRLEQLLLHTGQYDPTKPAESVSLTEFATQFIADSLIFDQATFEVVPTRSGVPAYISIVDPSTIRLLDPAARKANDPFAVQVVNGAIVESFFHDELAFCVRNPRSGINAYGYGTGEIETLVREVTGMLWAMDYNRKYFSQGSTTKGILNFKGPIPDRHLQSFRRQWYAMVSGVANAWKTPITNAEELQWINMQMSNRDMEYSAWIDFLIKVACARYNIAPEEVNFSYGNTGQSQAMGTAPVEEKLKASKDLGLRPLVRWFFVCLNRHFIRRLNPAFEAIPVGLDEEGAEAETKLLKDQTSIYLTVNEARQQVELPPLPDEQGEVILNPTWLQFVQAKEAAQQDAMQQDGEEPDATPESVGPDDSFNEDSGFAVTDEGAPSPFDIED